MRRILRVNASGFPERRRSWRAAIAAAVVLVCPAVIGAASSPDTAPKIVPTSATVTTSRGDYRLAIYPAVADDPAKPLVLVISGEGGWRSFDDTLATWFAQAGYWTGGFDVMKYFWRAQDDRKALATDVRVYVSALAAAAHRSPDARVLLVGFSFGADLAPWIAGGGGWDNRIAGVVMLGPDATGSLEFRLSEMMGFDPSDHVFDVAAALKTRSGVPALFVHGGADRSSVAPVLHAATSGPKSLVTVPAADHHFSGHQEELRRTLLDGVARLLAPAGSSR